MKCICVIRKLFFFNLLSLLWWPYFCDIKQNGESPQGIQNFKDPHDPHRIANVPTKQGETLEQPSLESELKENVQSSVEFVNIEPEMKDGKETTKEETILPGVTEPLHIEQSVKQLKNKVTVSNLESSREVPVNKQKEDISVLKKNQADEEMEQVDVHSPERLIEENLIKNDATKASAKLEPATTTKEIPSDKMQKLMEAEMTTKPVGSDTSAGASIVMKATSRETVHSMLPVDVSSFIDPTDNVHHPPQYDGMPSFDEWKKMMLAEQEKGGQKMPSPGPPGKKISSQKRRRNYSSYECGAKIVASNSEAEGTSRILNELVDEYMLNPCKAKIWFVIELCETVQASQIELANFELFSSCPKEFAVYSSDNFPTRDWVLLGTFSAAEQRVLQSFELKQEGFGKFIKIELMSYYGKEHYCPLSVVRIFGTSMVDEYEEMETLADRSDVPDDDLDRLDIPVEDQGSSNIFGSATDAVLNIVKKAALALGQHQPLEDGENNETTSEPQNVSETKLCKFISSTDKCEDVEVRNDSKSTISPLVDFPVPPSAVHQSLFRHLHRCDQCVSSNLGYYSLAQPHCRFFQAALGPVMFKALCDWFKEHPLVIAHEVPVIVDHSIDTMISGSSFTISPTKSPPPQIIRIPLESDTSFTIASQNSSFASTSSNLDKSITVDITNISRTRLNKTLIVPDKIKLEPSIQPRKTVQDDKTLERNDSAIVSNLEKSSQILQSSAILSSLVTEVKPSIPEKMEVPIEKRPSRTETAAAGVMLSELVSNETVGTKISDIEEEQINDMLIDTSVVIPEDMTSIEITPGSELPPGFKADDKFPDVRIDLQEKPEPVVTAGVTSTSVGQKESVFMRMSNRIKSLEINMSLSSQYLQELSQRYRRQMEDMQRAFNRTIGTLNDTAKKAAEKDLKQQDIINNLQLQVANLTQTVDLLMNERSSVFRQMIETHVCLMVIEAIVMITIMSLCVRRISSSALSMTPAKKDVVLMSPRYVNKRRNSADSSTPPVARKVKKRSSSEEAIAAGEKLLHVELLPVLETVQKVKKKNKKRNRGIRRSISHPIVQPRDLSPTSSSLNSYKEKQNDTNCEESLFIQSKPQHVTCQANHICENCNSETPSSCTVAKASEKEKRTHSGPLRNLTNGKVEGLSQSSSQLRSNSLVKEKERFSFKKFLKFQKRDSI